MTDEHGHGHDLSHRTLQELLGHTQATLTDVAELHARSLEYEDRRDQPAQAEAVALATATGIVKNFDSAVDAGTRSVGVYNPTALQVYLGVGGSATAAARAWPVPPKAGLVLPFTANEFELGIDPADAAALATLDDNTAVVFLLRFPTVQRFAFFALP